MVWFVAFTVGPWMLLACLFIGLSRPRSCCCSLPQPVALQPKDRCFSRVRPCRETDEDAHHEGEENQPERAASVRRNRSIRNNTNNMNNNNVSNARSKQAK